MSKSNIVSLAKVRELKNAENEDRAYQALILSMDKFELLEEMVRFQENRSKTGHLTVSMMVRGKYLFKALEDSAETQELKLLTGSYRRHLEHELRAYSLGQKTEANGSGPAPQEDTDIECELEIEEEAE